LDLSVGSIVGLSGVFVAGLMLAGVPVPFAIILIAFLGAAIGLVNGLISTKLKIPSIIVTLGMSSIVTGLNYMYTKGKAVGTAWLWSPMTD
jgi:ribose transport system permease protein